MLPCSERWGWSSVSWGWCAWCVSLARCTNWLASTEGPFQRNGRRQRDNRLLLVGDGEEPEAVLGVATTVFRWNALRGADWLWVTGNPLSRFAAVATMDGAHVVVVKRPLLPGVAQAAAANRHRCIAAARSRSESQDGTSERRPGHLALPVPPSDVTRPSAHSGSRVGRSGGCRRTTGVRSIRFLGPDRRDRGRDRGRRRYAVLRVRSSGWRQVHARSQPSDPLHDRLVPLEDLRTAIGGRRLLTRVGFVSTAGTIRGGFAILAGSGLVIYGEVSPSPGRIVCLHGTEQVSADEVEGLATLMGQHQLLLVNWPRALIAQADPHELDRLLR